MNAGNSAPLAAEQPIYRFEDLGLQAGSRVQMQLPATHDKGHFTVLIGYSPGETLLLRTPEVNGMPLTVVEGERVVVRAFSGVTAFAFTSVVERVCREPYSYFHLAFPATIRGTRVRDALRVRVHLEALVKSAAGGEAQPATVLNLSPTGALVEAQGDLGPEGTRVAISFGFVLQQGDEHVRFAAAGIIRSATPAAGAEGPVRYGVEFEDLDHTHRLELQALVYQIALQAHDSIT